ncbi:hypothetical protein K461DRAFT_175742 [Myriangium duriaei CBS 260.36]|uniref:Uncharacterized protein n=1 Tax=Myriangium duriaei CBS 260.36 TaxID=1168546 RepID=A0A9P4IYY5_9PEZI|nr:hypothetical protein K461DRAFT_175742 [Myriangium duriaei CBS 260.36]
MLGHAKSWIKYGSAREAWLAGYQRRHCSITGAAQPPSFSNREPVFCLRQRFLSRTIRTLNTVRYDEVLTGKITDYVASQRSRAMRFNMVCLNFSAGFAAYSIPFAKKTV